jgi:hypothetical protein
MSQIIPSGQPSRLGFSSGDQVRLKRDRNRAHGILDQEDAEAPGNWRIVFDDGGSAWHRAIEFVHA